MKCKCRFKVTGRLKPDAPISVTVRGISYEFEAQNGIVTHIVVTFPLDRQYWPTVKPSFSPGVKFHIDIPAPPHLLLVQMQLRTLEGLLSLYGLHSIDIQHLEREWLADSEEEENDLRMSGIFSFKHESKHLDDSELLRYHLILLLNQYRQSTMPIK